MKNPMMKDAHLKRKTRSSLTKTQNIRIPLCKTSILEISTHFVKKKRKKFDPFTRSKTIKDSAID